MIPWTYSTTSYPLKKGAFITLLPLHTNSPFDIYYMRQGKMEEAAQGFQMSRTIREAYL